MKKIEIEVTEDIYKKLESMTSDNLTLQKLMNIIIARFLNK